MAAIATVLSLIAAPPAAAYFARLGSFGTAGAGQGEFDGARSVATDGRGFIYVLDQTGQPKQRVQKLSLDGRFVTAWRVPGHIAADPDGNLYAIDQPGRRVAKFSSSGQLLDPDFGRVAAEPQGIATDKDRNVYVSTNGGTKKLSPSGVFLGSFDISPGALAIDSQGSLYLAPLSPWPVRKYRSDGTFVRSIGSVALESREIPAPKPKDAEFSFFGPRAIAVDTAGDLWISDPGNDRLQKFSASGRFVTTCGRPDGDPFESAGELATGSDGNIYVSQYAEILRFGEAGPPAVPCDDTAPKLTDTRIRPRRFVPVHAAARQGAVLRYRLSEDSSVRIFIDRRFVGRRVGDRCKRVAAGPPRDHRCAGYRRKGTLRQEGVPGRNKLSFSGRLRGQPLRPGRYRVRLRATDVADNRSRQRIVRFHVLKP